MKAQASCVVSRGLLVLVVLSGGGLASRRAQAQGNESADSLIQRGVDLRTQGKDDEALAAFKKAASLKETPKARAQIGLAELALGLWVLAEADLGKALETAKDPWIAKNRPTLDGAMRNIRTHLADLAVWGTPEGAEVLVAGKIVGTLPNVAIRVQAEQIMLQVRHPGFLDLQRPLNVSAGDHLREHVELAPALAPAGVAKLPSKGPASSTNDPAEEGTTLVRRAPSESSESSPVYTRWWFWTGIGVLVAAGAGGAYLATRKSSPGPACNSRCDAWPN